MFEFMKVPVSVKKQALACGRWVARWRSGRRWMAVVGVVAGLAMAACGAGDGDGATETPRERCLRLKDHLVDVQLQSVTVDRAQHQAALRAALDVAFVADCVERMDDEARDCRLAASDAAALVACDVAAAGGAAEPRPEASSER